MKKKLFLTGGRGDIGAAIKELFLERGYEVIAPTSHELDLKDFSAIKHFFDHQTALDVFIHCAGINYPKSFTDISDEDFLTTMQINALSFYKMTHELMRQQLLNSSGFILAISSIYGIISRKKRFSYAASKHCLTGMIQTLALELTERKIKTNGLAPGFVDTKLTRQNNSAETIRDFEKKIPLGCLAQPTDIAKIAYFLCSNENTYINGQVIIADGGYTIGGYET